MVNLLRDYCVEVNHYSYAFSPPLHIAIKNNYNKIAKALLRVNLGKSGHAFCTALKFTLNEKYKKNIHLLCESVDSIQTSLFGLLCDTMLKNILTYLIPIRVVANIHFNYRGDVPILLALQNDNTEIVKLLLD